MTDCKCLRALSGGSGAKRPGPGLRGAGSLRSDPGPGDDILGKSVASSLLEPFDGQTGRHTLPDMAWSGISIVGLRRDAANASLGIFRFSTNIRSWCENCV
ncbi:hypothetical protein LIP_2135 [Limnochorda pilosa]|uniref:Uncharacterized protein n=1 Tax=Limnochorda pilosa TaxID=1555112 RepID=A0A0K2SLH4_LIMPI|nr:hypothetical protein LIP_2135 [Limnochorda pilosa]